MSERKNINNLFQEKFENHEVTPEEFIWENIELKLKEKKKRRVIPFWSKLSGIAAALVIGFFAYNGLNTTNDNENSVVNQEKNDKENSKDSVEKNTNPVVTNGSKTINSDNSKTISSDNNVNNVVVVKETNSQSDENNKTNFKTNKIDVKSNNGTQVANSEINKKPLVKTDKIKSNSDSQIVNNGSKKDKNRKISLKLSNNNSNNEIAFEKNNDLKEKNKINNSSRNEALVQPETKEKEKNNSVVDKFVNPSKENNSIVKNTTSDRKTSVLTPKTDEPILKKNDSTSVASVEPNALEELLIEKEKQTVTEQKINRWQVTSNVAPIYFGSTSNGSPLDSKLVNNDKVYSAENISYGIGVNYAVNKKIKIRTGVNILNVDYDTNGILYYQNPTVSSRLSGLNPNVPGSLLVIESLSNINTLFNRSFQKFEGSLNQKLGYIEMPLEVTYKILDKNFGIDLIGGMSTLVLNRNEIYLQSTELNLKIGEANNLNNVHFSGNLGLGLKYGFFKRLEARIEPVFKYQINTFNNDAGNFKPFVFGVYSGINYIF
jgi:hypothetical protein